MQRGVREQIASLEFLTELRALTLAFDVPLILDGRSCSVELARAWIALQPDAIALHLHGGPGVIIGRDILTAAREVEASSLIRANILLDVSSASQINWNC